MRSVGDGYGNDDHSRWAAAQEAYEISCAAQRRQAARVIASHALDASDCANLLAMLGLDVPRHPS